MAMPYTNKKNMMRQKNNSKIWHIQKLAKKTRQKHFIIWEILI